MQYVYREPLLAVQFDLTIYDSKTHTQTHTHTHTCARTLQPIIPDASGLVVFTLGPTPPA